jgi:hypothetical protein
MPKAFNAHPDHPVIGTLLRLHANIGGRILDNQAQGKRLQEDMKAIEAVIHMFDPAFDVRPIAVRRRKANPWFKRGACVQHALDVLRKTEGPLTTKEVAVRMLQETGIAKPDTKQVRNLIGAVNRSLKGHAGKSVALVGEGTPARWALIVECPLAGAPIGQASEKASQVPVR